MLAGPNGAGKTYFSRDFVPRYTNSNIFINADNIAKSLVNLSPLSASILASKMMLTKIDEVSETGDDFVLETTLSGKIYSKRIRDLRRRGYSVHLIFYWISHVDICVERVKQRVAQGGHFIPEETIRRRYDAGMRNLFTLYMESVDYLEIYDNSDFNNKRLIAEYVSPLELDRQRINNKGILQKKRKQPFRIENPSLFRDLLRGASN